MTKRDYKVIARTLYMVKAPMNVIEALAEVFSNDNKNFVDKVFFAEAAWSSTTKDHHNEG